MRTSTLTQYVLKSTPSTKTLYEPAGSPRTTTYPVSSKSTFFRGTYSDTVLLHTTRYASRRGFTSGITACTSSLSPHTHCRRMSNVSGFIENSCSLIFTATTSFSEPNTS